MKKKFWKNQISLFIIIFIFCTNGIVAEEKLSNKKIVVDTPACLNIEKSNRWIASFVQGQLTTDFQNYSTLTVLDRLAVESLIAEQQRAEEKAYVSNRGGDDSSIYASLINADYLIKVEISKTGKTYALRCSVQDVNTATAVTGAAHSATTITEAQLMDGSSIHKASYDLLSGMKAGNSKLTDLLDYKTQNKDEVEANCNVAKGIQAKNDGNLIDALVYFQKAVENSKTAKESSSRMEQLVSPTTVKSNAEWERIVQDVNLEEQWYKLWKDFEQYVQKSAIACLFFDRVDWEIQNNNSDTAIVTVYYSSILNPEIVALYKFLEEAYEKTPKRRASEWRGHTKLEEGERFRNYGDNSSLFYTKTPIKARVQLLDGKGKVLGEKEKDFLAEYEEPGSRLVNHNWIPDTYYKEFSIKISSITDEMKVNIISDTPRIKVIEKPKGL